MSPRLPFIVAVARQLGSGGSELGQRVARRLGINYVDRQILRRAAEALGMPESDLAERSERLEGFWARLLHPFALGAPTDVFSPPPSQTPPSDERIMAVERDILLELAAEGDCVVVGHAGFHLLRERGRLLNLFAHAAEPFRAARVRKHYGAPDEATALAMIADSDRDRARYVREVAGEDWYDARNYHLCLDVGSMGLDAAEEIVVSLARRFAAENGAEDVAGDAAEDVAGGAND